MLFEISPNNFWYQISFKKVFFYKNDAFHTFSGSVMTYFVTS